MTYNPDPHNEIEPEQDSGFELLPEGRYRVVVVAAQPKQWADSGETHWRLECDVLEPAKHAGKKFWYSLSFPQPVDPTLAPNEVTQQKRRIGKAKWDWKQLGLTFPLNLDSDYDRVISRTVCVDIKHKPGKKNPKQMFANAYRLDPDSGPGSVNPDAAVSQQQAETEIPF